VRDLEIERGRAALIGDTQVALFLLHDGRVHAVSNLDPYSGAHVISRGIVGTRQDAPTVASPMFKQVFDLRTGACLDTQGKDPRPLAVWPAAVEHGRVLIRWEQQP
jgi:nitrite reductase (NADH) small subunit